VEKEEEKVKLLTVSGFGKRQREGEGGKEGEV
jgi:hypothetical protein